MKNYEQPAIELIKFSVMEVLAASNEERTPGWSNDPDDEQPAEGL